MSARIMAARLDWSPLRIELKRFPRGINKKQDEWTPSHTAEEAMKRLEEGLTI